MSRLSMKVFMELCGGYLNKQINIFKYINSLEATTDERLALENYMNSDDFEYDGATTRAIDAKLAELRLK